MFVIGDWVSAACMMDHSSTQGMDWHSDDAFEGHSLIEAAAGSVTSRGLLYSLMQPAPRRFLSLKSPALFTINKAAIINRTELQRMCWAANRSVGSNCGSRSMSNLVYLGHYILSSLCVSTGFVQYLSAQESIFYANHPSEQYHTMPKYSLAAAFLLLCQYTLAVFAAASTTAL